MKEDARTDWSQSKVLAKAITRSRELRLCAPDYATMLRQIIFLSDVIVSVRARTEDESDQFARLVLKELGIWCYLAYEEMDNEQFLFQAEKCLNAASRRSCGSSPCINERGSFVRLPSDPELNTYYAQVLWAKIQWHSASRSDQILCAELLEQCVQGDSAFLSGEIWFRLGVVYEKGIGRRPNIQRAQHCFDRARQYGFKIS